MLKPTFRTVPSLIANLPHKLGNFRIPSDDDSAFASRDLFVGIERKYPSIPECAYPSTVVFSTDRFACVLDNTEVMTLCDHKNSLEVCWATEGMYYDDGLCSESYCQLDSAGIQIERVRFNIDED